MVEEGTGLVGLLLCVLLRYTRHCICDTVPPCRSCVHMFTASVNAGHFEGKPE